MLENAQIVLVGPLTELSGNLHTMSRVAASCNRLLGGGPRQRRNHHNKSDSNDAGDNDEEAVRDSVFGVATGLISPQTVLCRHDAPHQVKVIDSCDPPSCENEEGCHDDTENEGTKREQVQLCLLLHALRAGKVVFPEFFSRDEGDSDDNMTTGHAAPEAPSSSCSSSSSLPAPVTMMSRVGERSQRHEGSCGRCWRCRARNAKRFALVFGGTDVNEFAKEGTLRRQMRRVVERMDVVVCFSEVFAEDVAQVWPEVTFRHSPTPPPAAGHDWLTQVDKNNQKSQGPMVHIIRQGVQRTFSSSFHDRNGPPPSVSHTLSNILSHVAQADGDKTREPGSMDQSPTRVVLWCGGLRHVKDPLFALQASQSPYWPPSVVLVLVGPILDTACAEELFSAFSSSHHENESSTERPTTKCRITKNGACLWHPGVPHETIVSFLEDPRVCAVINTSLSEGQSQSLLLAMAHRVPVIGRRIRTNVDLLLVEPHTDDDDEEAFHHPHHQVLPTRNEPPPPPSLRAATRGEDRSIPHQRAEERTERPPPPRGWLVDYPIELAQTVAYLVREESEEERNQRVERASLFVQRFHTIEGEQLLYQQMVENLIAS